MDTREQIVKYIKSLSVQDRIKLENMIKHGVTCCFGLAKQLKIPVEEVNAELRSVFK